MKTLNLSTGAFILGALGASFAACSAQSTGSPPRSDGTAGQASQGTSGGGTVIGGTGTAGTPGGFGTAGAPGGLGTAGTPGGFGTSGAPGGFGTSGATGTGTAGAPAGTAGAAAMSCGTLTQSPADAKCCIAAGTATDLAIDDVEDGNNVILPVGNRQGYWYSYADAATTQMPKGAPFPSTPGGNPCSLTPIPPACGLAMGAPGMAGSTVASMEISGTVAIATATVPAYAGLGFDFNNHFAKSCPYDATAYKGFTFYAKGSPFSARVKIPATTATTSDSGTCTVNCEGHYGILIAPPPDGSWAKQTVTFSDPTFKPPSWVTTPPAFTQNQILAVQFQVDGSTAATAYSFAVDDLAFF